MEDKVIIQRIIEIIKTDGDDMTDGECIDAIIEVIESGYSPEWGFK